MNIFSALDLTMTTKKFDKKMDKKSTKNKIK